MVVVTLLLQKFDLIFLILCLDYIKKKGIIKKFQF
jgi:hypothetical protein